MARIVQVGGGIVGLANAMLLAKDGHDVAVLERDSAAPVDPSAAWDSWERNDVFAEPRLLDTVLANDPGPVPAWESGLSPTRHQLVALATAPD